MTTSIFSIQTYSNLSDKTNLQIIFCVDVQFFQTLQKSLKSCFQKVWVSCSLILII